MATKKTKGTTTTLEILPPEHSKEALEVINDGFSLVTFLQGLAKFFSTATDLERRATATLATARTLTVPTTKAEDAALQDFVRGARADRKGVEAHWEITSRISQFHKRLTAKRGIAVEALKTAEELATRQHERYVQAEKERAAAEQRRLQREEDERAERARQETLASYEAAAVAAEEASPELSEREQRVVQLVQHGNEWQGACRIAGYRDPVAQAARLSTSPKIKAALEAARQAASIRAQAAATKELPLPADVVEVAPELNKGDRGTWTAQVVDVDLLRQAAFTDKSLGIPLDIFDVNPAALNRYARSLEKRIELWPGVVAKHKLTVV